MSESLVLYVEASWTSPWVCTAHVALREKRLPFATAIAMIRKGSGAIDAMHERTLTGTAPVLQHGGFWLAESSAIVEYLEEAFPEPRVLPADRCDRARARQLMAWLRHEHEALRRERPTERVIYPGPELPPLSPVARASADRIVAVAERLGADGKGHVLGGQFGVIDVELAFNLKRVMMAPDHAVPEALAAYAAAVWARPSVREFLDHPRPPRPPPG